MTSTTDAMGEDLSYSDNVAPTVKAIELDKPEGNYTTGEVIKLSKHLLKMKLYQAHHELN